MTETQGPQGGGRLQLWLLLLVFGGPVVAAGLLYANADRWLGHSGSGHHGQLLDPARSLQEFPVRGPEGSRLGLEFLRGKWTLVYIGSAQCASECRTDLYSMRQAHKAQGKNIGRVQRLFVTREGLPTDGAQAFLTKKHPHLRLGRVTPGESLEAFAVGERGAPARPGGIYLVDPNANLVLRYSSGAAAGGILKDLETLLKHSSIG